MSCELRQITPDYTQKLLADPDLVLHYAERAESGRLPKEAPDSWHSRFASYPIMKAICLTIICVVALVGCNQSRPSEAFTVFNEGVSYSLEASQETDVTKAAALERKAIEKYRQTFQLDSAHGMVRAALGHSYYLLDEYPQAIRWFEASNRIDTASVAAYRELGICRIAMNHCEPGWQDLQTAFRLDSLNGKDRLAETKKITTDDLYHLGSQACGYGETYDRQGEREKGRGFEELGLNALFMAYAIDSSRKDIATAIAEHTGQLGDSARQKKYARLAR